MTKADFLTDLSRRLGAFSAPERERFVTYYDEMLSDRMEDGMTEDEAIGSLEPIDVIAGRIIAENPPPARRQRTGAGKWALIVLGSPLWLPLIIAFAAVALALLIALWAALVAVCACCIVFPIAGIAMMLSGVLTLFTRPATGIFSIGIGLVVSALGIWSLRLMRHLLTHGARITRGLFVWLKRLVKKEAA